RCTVRHSESHHPLIWSLRCDLHGRVDGGRGTSDIGLPLRHPCDRPRAHSSNRLLTPQRSHIPGKNFVRRGHSGEAILGHVLFVCLGHDFIPPAGQGSTVGPEEHGCTQIGVSSSRGGRADRITVPVMTGIASDVHTTVERRVVNGSHHQHHFARRIL